MRVDDNDKMMIDIKKKMKRERDGNDEIDDNDNYGDSNDE